MISNLKFPLSDKWNYGINCIPSDSSVIGNEILSDGDGTYIYFNNVNNTLNCTGTWSFYGANLQYPLATKKVLYINDLDSLYVTATIQIGSVSSACDRIAYGCPVLSPMSWTTALIGIPMYDETSHRNLWLEISPYWTEYAYFGSNPLWLFHGESPTEELYRIKVDTPMHAGETRNFHINVLDIIKSLTWGQVNNINWDTVHIGDGLYFGVESWGHTFTDMYIKNIDFTYEETTIPPVLTTIVISPNTASVNIGDIQQLTAICLDQNSNVFPCPILTWESDSPATASVDDSGLVTGLIDGSSTITVISPILSNTSVITVTAPSPPPNPPPVEAGISGLLIASLAVGALLMISDSSKRQEINKDRSLNRRTN